LLNSKNWGERVGLHINSPEYGLEEFKQGKVIHENHVIKEMGDIKGKNVLHLMCHFGLDTLCWARDFGAVMTGVDFAEEAVHVAQSLAKELNIQNVKFIQSDIYQLPNQLHEKFDVVVMTHGVLCWLPDLVGIMKIVAEFLKEGGKYYLCDDHPVTNMFENTLTVENSYFYERIEEYGEYSYVPSEVKLQNTKSVEWTHSLADILNSILGAKMQLIFYNEHPFTFWNRFPDMDIDNTGHWLKGEHKNHVPLVFSVMAKKI